MFSHDDHKVFGEMHNQLQKHAFNSQIEKPKSLGLFGTFFKLWAAYAIVTTLIGGTLFATLAYIAYHFISKWW
jgi:hypothetical protein